MSAISPELRPDPTVSDDGSPWLAVLVVIASVVALTDLLLFAMIRAIVPPLAGGVLFTVVGLLLVRRWRRAGIVVIGLTSLVMLAGAVPFAIDHLAHPESGIDFAHAMIGTVGRLLALGAVIGALRGSSTSGARRFGAASLGLAALTVLAAGLATVATSGADADDGDVEVVVDAAAFPDSIHVTSGDTLFVDNRDLFRHTFTVEGSDLDVELPAKQGVRVPVDLEPGAYNVICDVPGHDFMTATLEVS